VALGSVLVRMLGKGVTITVEDAVAVELATEVAVTVTVKLLERGTGPT
jgi:hypothetical protein